MDKGSANYENIENNLFNGQKDSRSPPLPHPFYCSYSARGHDIKCPQSVAARISGGGQQQDRAAAPGDQARVITRHAVCTGHTLVHGN